MADFIKFTSELKVDLMECSASDCHVMAAARVSTKGNEAKFDWTGEARTGLIKYLMSNRHGTPFEHNYFEFFISAPIFVFREFHRHRIGFSYNEESGRYKQLEPKFYIPARERDLMQVPGSKPGRYEYAPASDDDYRQVLSHLEESCVDAYEKYLEMLEHGVAKEVARMHLPVNIYSSMYVACNARSIMAFLSLRQKRTKREPSVLNASATEPWSIVYKGEAFFPSNPMKEINIVADKMEEFLAEKMPITWGAFKEAGYVAP